MQKQGIVDQMKTSNRTQIQVLDVVYEYHLVSHRLQILRVIGGIHI
jgi:hypothetical protein